MPPKFDGEYTQWDRYSLIADVVLQVDLEAEADAELPMGSTVYPPNIPPTPSAHATHTDTLPSKFAIFDFLEDDINSPPSNRDRLHQNVAYPFTGDVPTRIRAFYRQILAAMPSLRTLPAG